MSYHRPTHGVLGESYGVPGSSPRLLDPVLGGCGGVGGFALGDTAKKEALKAAQYKARMGADVSRARQIADGVTFRKPTRATISGGKVNVPVASFWTDWNASAAQIVAPFAGIVNALPVASSLKTKLKSRPLDALLDIFDPIEAKVGRAVDRVLQQKGNTQNFFGKNMNLKRVQPTDAKADASTANLMRSLRTIEAFFVLSFTQPVEFAAALLTEGVNIIGDIAQASAEVASQVAEAAGQAAADVIQAASDAAAAVSAFFGLGGFSLGEPATASAGTAAAGAAVAAAPAEVALLDALLATLAGIIAGALDTALVTGAQLVGDMILGNGKPAETSSQGVPVSTRFVSPVALAQGRASGSFQTTGQGTGAQGGGDERDSVLGGGVSPVVIVGGFAAVIGLAFVLSKRR